MKTGYIKVRANHSGRKPPLLSIPVYVVDQKIIFGRTDYLITPVGGTGQAWVMSSRLERIAEVTE